MEQHSFSLIEYFGLMGVIIFAAGVAIRQLWTAFRHSQEARIKEARENAEAVRKLAESSNASIDGLTRVLSARSGRGDF